MAVFLIEGRRSLTLPPLLLLSILFKHQKILLFVALIQSVNPGEFLILVVRAINHEGVRDFLLDWHEALGAEDETFDALRMENMRWVAAKLDNILLCTTCVQVTSTVKMVFKLIRLHLQLGEGQFAALAVV